MLKLIIIAIILTISYILLAGLMRVTGKSTPIITNIKHDEDNDKDN